MKRNPLMTLALAAGLSAMLAFPAQAQRQDHYMVLSTAKTQLSAGDTFDVSALFTPGKDAGGNTIKVTTLQSTLIYDPTVFELVANPSNGQYYDVAKDSSNSPLFTDYGGNLSPFGNAPGTFSITQNADPSKNHDYTFIQYLGLRAGSKTTLTGTDIAFATFHFQVLANPSPKGNDTIYYSSALLKPSDYDSSTDPSFYASYVLPSPNPTTTLFQEGALNGWVTFQVNPAAVPEVSTVVMFAMGLTPALMLWRKRRSV